MAVAIVLKGAQDVRLVHWAARIARARRSGLVLFWAMRRRGQVKSVSSQDDPEIPSDLKRICEQLDAEDFDVTLRETDSQLPLEVVSISSPQVHIELEQQVERHGVNCLIIPREPQVKSGTPDALIHEHLLSHVPCEIVLLTAGREDSGDCRTIVTPVGEGPHSASCLRMANDIAAVSEANLIALHVEPEVDITASQAATHILDKTVDRALGSEQQRVSKRVVLADDVITGIKEALDASPDLIILGIKRSGIVRRFSSQGIADKLVNSNPGPAIAVVQSAIPLSSQFGRWLDQVLRGKVPQLPRDQRISLVERIQRSSQWDFDFILLICMSTLIAAGGLILDSGPVVIGAMLVAPLMTPLLGTGLSITQGNRILFRGTLLTVMRGFLVAFVISFLIGKLAADDVTSEMTRRGSPRVLDILVAMVGGIAAAYASGRPNLLSALPGVAIAASLVPPIATSGISASLYDFTLAGNSALLFFTNIIAIILGTWIAFRAVGIRSMHEHGEFDRWTAGATTALLVLTISLGIYESTMPARKSDLLQSRLNQLAAKDQWTCTDTSSDHVNGKRVVTVYLESPKPMPAARLDEIRAAVKDAYERPPAVKFVTTTGMGD